MTLQVVMVTKDRPRLFEQAIRSLYAHTEDFQLLVVDDCSWELGLVYELALEFGFALMLNDSPMPLGGSKNRAMQRMADGLVYLTDNDVYFKPGWSETLLEAWRVRPPDIGLLGGGCHEWLGTNRTADVAGFQYHYKDAVSGWSWLTEKLLWEQYGPFAADALGSGKSEDWDFCQKLKKAGYEVASIWPEVVVHCGRTNTEGQPAIGAVTIRDVAGIIVE
jgi:GT2 family glycosyltransferase